MAIRLLLTISIKKLSHVKLIAMDDDIKRFALEEISFQERATLYQFYADALDHLDSKGILQPRLNPESESRLMVMQAMMESNKFINGLFRVHLARLNNNFHDSESWKEISKILGRKGLDRENCIYYLILSCRIQQSLTSYLDTIEATFYVGLIFYQMKEYDAAIEHLEEIIERIPNSNISEYYAQICNLIATLYVTKQNFDKANKFSDLSLAAGCNFGDLYLVKSTYSLINGRLKKSYEFGLKALESYKNDIFYTAWDIQGKQRQKAKNRGISNAYTDIGSYFQMNGDYENALFHFHKSIEYGGNPSVNFSIGAIYAILGDREKMNEYIDLGTDHLDISKPHHQVMINAILLDDGYKYKGLRDDILLILLRRNIISDQLYKVGRKISKVASTDNLESLLSYVADGKLVEALGNNRLLMEYNENTFINQLLGRLNKIEQDNNMGILSSENYALERNKIQNSYIKFLTDEIRRKRK